MPRLAEASHWPLAIASTQPRQISREERRRPQDQRDPRRQPGRHVDAEQPEPEEGEEQLHQQRRALQQLDIEPRQPRQRTAPADPQRTEAAAPTTPPPTKETSDRSTVQRGGEKQVAQDVPEGEFGHRAALRGKINPPSSSQRLAQRGSPGSR